MYRTIEYAMHFVGKPYIWGDKVPVLGGFDCSGIVCEILRSVGLVGKENLNAQMLFNRFHITGYHGAPPGAGVLAFYGTKVTDISHVAFMIDPYRIIEAGGGDHTTTTPEAADARGAMVRIRLLSHRPDLLTLIKPRYSAIGVV